MLHQQALQASQKGYSQAVKRLVSTYLGDVYCKSLRYLGGALKLTPNTDTILAESAQAAADHARQKALDYVGAEIAKALN